MHVFRVVASVFALFSASLLSAAQAEEDAILVLDASGSMWGQIDGEAKIVSARKVIDDLLTDLPADRRLGLVAYGHNRKGDCSDIEELAAVGADRASIKAAVNGVNPKGKTPLSESVKFAAEKLKYTENKATVILISDGLETCDNDPCAVGAALEQAGVDFTAHVIGFDIAEEDRAQLECLASNTGGRYITASNADELADALTETVVQAPAQPETRTTGVTVRATELSGGPLITSGLNWKIQQAGGGDVLFEAADVGVQETELPPGVYDIFVERPADGLKGEARNVTVSRFSSKTVTIPLELSFEATIRVVPETEGPVGSEIIVYWTGPDRKSDYVTIVEKGARPNTYINYAYTNGGNPLKLSMPNDAGEYEVRYVLGSPRKVLASAPITATAVEATLAAVDTIAAGEDFDVTWTGPGYDNDWVTVVKPDAGERGYINYAYTRNGNPLTLKAPVEPGDYELRYVQRGQRIIARKPITVTSVEATVSGPETAMAGTRHEVSWTGPASDNDWITVTTRDASERSYTSYQYTRKGNPVILRMPLEPGEYEFRYVQLGKKVIARQPITITPAEVSLETPASAAVGAPVEVSWTGPAEQSDMITIVKPEEGERRYTSYKYPKNANPVTLTMPLEPGEYEFRYILDGRKVVFRAPVTLTDIEASVDAPASAKAGETVSVQWTGPAYQRDWVTITKPDAAENRYTSYKYPKNGNPLTLKAPAEPGDYEVRYVLGGKRVIVRKPITITPAE